MTQHKFHTIDLPSLINSIHRQTIGFDNLFEQLDRNLNNGRSDSNYPPHNMLKLDDTHWIIELAVAGFGQDELDVEQEKNVLTIKGTKAEADTREYTHKGISTRNFERQVTLGEYVEVRGVTVQNGILAIALEQVVPEEQKAKKIAITFAK